MTIIITDVIAREIRFPTSRELARRERDLDLAIVKNGRYMPPLESGYGVDLKSQSLKDYEYPDGRAWLD